MAYYCGDIGLSIDVFYRSTMRELASVSYGYELKQRRELEKTRLLCYYGAAGNLKKGTKLTDIMPFDWDNETREIDEIAMLAEVQKSKEFWKKIDDKNGTTNS